MSDAQRACRCRCAPSSSRSPSSSAGTASPSSAAAPSVAPLIDINTAIMKGLRGDVEAAA